MQMKVEIRRDRKTAFPCVRFWTRNRPQEPYVCLIPREIYFALLPITKIQVEQFVWEHGFPPAELSWFMERLALESDRIRNRYPEQVGTLRRPSLTNLCNENLSALIATNLTVWRDRAELKIGTSDKRFPTPASEWGQVLEFIGGRAPSDLEWLRLKHGSSAIPTRFLLDKALDLYPRVGERSTVETRSVRRLLQSLKQFAEDGWSGLPFLDNGGYELLSNFGEVKRLAADTARGIPPGDEIRALVAGDSVLWPALDGISDANFRLLLKRNLPVVTVRPVFEIAALMREVSVFECDVDPVSAPEQPFMEVRQSPGAPRRVFGQIFKWKRPAGIRDLARYAPTESILRGVCLHCFRKVSDDVANTEGVYYCWVERQAREGNAVENQPENVARHTTARPTVRHDVVPRVYLELTNSFHGNRVRVVALNGFTKAGKTTWLMSLAGLMDYPDGNSILYKVFPETVKFHFTNCAVRDWGREADERDSKLPTERMWLDGLLPPRTIAGIEAARMPVHVAPVGGQFEESFIFNFSDFAGELLFGNFSANPNFTHVPTTMDIILFMPARDPSNQILQQFLGKMGNVVRNGKALKLRELNLILAFTKIDELKYGTADDRDLLHRIVPSPYRYPESSNEGLQRYLDEMYEVHLSLRNWLSEKKPQMKIVEDLFATVRYCGLSSFGFAPMGEYEEADFDQSIPFPPQPVRAIDPLLWLMHGNRVLRS